MSSSNKKGQPTVDPYDALGIPFGASDAEITKAYRKLALKLHPDKQRHGLNEGEQEKIAKQFHDIKEARAFLLETEHAEDRRQYDAKRMSERIRRETEAVREQHMSDRRKRMRDELKAKEARARKQGDDDGRVKKQQKKEEKDLVDQLRREGQRKREEQAERNLEKDLVRERQSQHKERKTALEERQVRLKWDRKKMKLSPSEESLASLLSIFGMVEQVEFIGKKGNQALVTFQHASSCQPCVDAYATSKEMRAKFVGQSKNKEDDEEEDTEQQASKPSAQSHASRTRDSETLEERRLRQAAEREALLRQMQQECETVREGIPTTDDRPTILKSAAKRDRSGMPTAFPLPFPKDDELSNLPPFKKLDILEEAIFGEIFTSEELRSLKSITNLVP